MGPRRFLSALERNSPMQAGFLLFVPRGMAWQEFLAWRVRRWAQLRSRRLSAHAVSAEAGVPAEHTPDKLKRLLGYRRD
jgi:hypothetical protein